MKKIQSTSSIILYVIHKEKKEIKRKLKSFLARTYKTNNHDINNNKCNTTKCQTQIDNV